MPRSPPSHVATATSRASAGATAAGTSEGILRHERRHDDGAPDDPRSVIYAARVVGSYSLPVLVVLLVVAPVWVSALVAAQVIVAVAAAVRLGVSLDDGGIVVKNLIRRHRYPWAEVELVEWRGPRLFGRAHRWVGLRTRDGRSPDVQATHTFWPSSRTASRKCSVARRRGGCARRVPESCQPVAQRRSVSTRCPSEPSPAPAGAAGHRSGWVSSRRTSTVSSGPRVWTTTVAVLPSAVSTRSVVSPSRCPSGGRFTSPIRDNAST